ncbi:hypothetical protein SAMN05444008_12067 [Cnuella takakiae]|uniref:Uncharacterized protein n=1 Tax=Cnuella takakiae TaxID=1302690 RepID=A0A1M5HUJ3_9BACT|nr:hypothetical protein [Cnuella takakiae]OLY95678.1 hypothetical protein BUE76_00210 [Cnuella takakiae]SHG19639.1 hypothetical protein SAMN05444008_12067 [Cnuella takakiae]
MAKSKTGGEFRKEITDALTRDALKRIGSLINNSKISNFATVYQHIPRSRLAETLGFNKSGFLRKKSIDGSLWRVDDIIRFSEATGAEAYKVFELLAQFKIESYSDEGT